MILIMACGMFTLAAAQIPYSTPVVAALDYAEEVGIDAEYFDRIISEVTGEENPTAEQTDPLIDAEDTEASGTTTEHIPDEADSPAEQTDVPIEETDPQA